MDQLKILKNLVSNMESTNSSMKNTLTKNHSNLSNRSGASSKTDRSESIQSAFSNFQAQNGHNNNHNTMNVNKKVLYPSSDLDLGSYKLSTKSIEGYDSDCLDDESVCEGSVLGV